MRDRSPSSTQLDLLAWCRPISSPESEGGPPPSHVIDTNSLLVTNNWGATHVMSDLTGRTALVTGASRGIGAATAVALAKAGVHVVAVARTANDELLLLAAVALAIPFIASRNRRNYFFVGLLLFDATRGVFEGWLRASLALAFAPLFEQARVCANHLAQLGISRQHLLTVEDDYTAQAMIMTDRDNNQITAFHPGAMMQAHITKIEKRDDIKLAIISPDGRDAMIQHAEQLKAADIPFVFEDRKSTRLNSSH